MPITCESGIDVQYANDDATKLVELASKCLQFEARERPEIKFLLTAVAPLQKQKEVLVFVLALNVELQFTFAVLLFSFQMYSTLFLRFTFSFS